MKIYHADSIDNGTTAADPKLEYMYTQMLESIGEDPTREGVLKTPQRAAKALQFLTQGYDQNVEDVVKRCHLQRRIRRNGHRQRH